MIPTTPPFTTAKAHLVGQSLPEIDIDIGDLRLLCDSAWRALLRANHPPYLFRVGGLPSRIEHDDNGRTVIRPLTPARILHELARVATWYAIVPFRGKILVKPPAAVGRDVLATPNPPLPILARIVHVPVFAPDGTLQLDPGYHEHSHTHYSPPKEQFVLYPVDVKPRAEIVEFARQFILQELFADFPFVSDADRAHAVGLFLLTFARDLIPGPTPLHLIESPTPGTGKGYLSSGCLYPAVGASVAVITQAHNGEEWRKRLTACFREGQSVVLIDNLTQPLDSGELAAALTALTWTDRILAKNETMSAPVRCIWVATANNPTMTTEIARRTIRIRLDATVERPWMRSEFRHPEFHQWLRDERVGLIWFAQTLIQSWISAGRPEPSCPQLGTFEDWRRVIGGVLEHVGIPGFLGNLREFYEVADVENQMLAAFVARWAEKFGQTEVGVAELFTIVCDEDWFELKGRNDRARRVSFGKQLQHYKDRVIGNHRIVLTRTVQHATQWKLIRLQT